MFKRILSVLVAVCLMFTLASIGMAKSSKDSIIISEKKEMIFDKKITDSCHASTVLPLDDGTVIAAWFGGSSEKKNDVNIYTSVRTEEDGWSEPVVVSAAAEIAHWNPVLFQKEDGTVILYFKVGKDTDYWQTYYATSTDGRSWSTPKELVPGDNSGGRGPVKNKPIRLKDGTVLAPASTEIDGEWRAFVDISNDDGETWTRTENVDSKYCICFKVPMIQPPCGSPPTALFICLQEQRSERFIAAILTITVRPGAELMPPSFPATTAASTSTPTTRAEFSWLITISVLPASVLLLFSPFLPTTVRPSPR